MEGGTLHLQQNVSRTLCQQPPLQLARRCCGEVRSSFDHRDACDDFCCATKAVQPCSLVQAVQSALREDHAAAPLHQSPARGAPQRPERKKTKRDILRRNAIHASNRRVLLVQRESQFVAC